MKTILQTSLGLTDKQQLKKAWAFAASNSSQRRQTINAVRDAVILSCSHEAKILGIRVGMRYEDAKMLLPGLRILVIKSSQI